jgi:hypothetical protein
MSALKIEFPEEYTLEEGNKKIEKKIHRLSKLGLGKISEFIGTTPIEAMFYIYLLKKYKSPCFLIETTGGDFWEILGINLKIREVYSAEESDYINEYLERIAVKLVHCIKNDANIIIIPLGLSLYYPDGTNDAHANVLIYRKKFNHIEHFEPHGKVGLFNNEKLNSSIDLFLKLFVEYVNIELLKNKARAQDFKPIELIESNQVCPYIRGFQHFEESSDIISYLEIEGGGYCSAWSMFFTELCLKNPSMTSSQIITSVFSTAQHKILPEDHFRHVIRGYVTLINEKISKYFSFLLGKKIDIGDVKKMDASQQTKLKDKLKIIINIETELAFNPNALDDKIKLLDIKSKKNLFLSNDEFYKINNELYTLEEYRNHINDFNSPINTPSSFTSVNVKKIKKTKKIKEIKRKEEKICPPGKELNLKTNRCVKIKPVSVMKLIKEQKKKLEEELSKKTKECPPGKELNQVTGRCNKIKTKTFKIKKDKKEKPKKEKKINKECPPGKELNQVTGRCVKIKTKTFKIKKEKKEKNKLEKGANKDCPPGKELNLKTNRCVKIKTKTVKNKKEKKI